MLRSILAVELAVRLDPALHAGLRDLLARAPHQMGHQQKWALYDAAAQWLLQYSSHWHAGCWDFFEDHNRALSDFDMWVKGMLTEEGSRKAPSGSPDPYRGEPRFLTFTMACLLVRGSPTERTMANVCNIPESRLWARESFERILSAVRYLNFASIQASTLYLIPNQLDWGLTTDDLRQPKFEYLRPIV